MRGSFSNIISILGSTQKKLTFSRSTKGGQPSGSLTELNGKLYGTTRFGGTNDDGVIFEYDPGSGAYTVRYNFLTATGSNPIGDLTMASNGKFYGLASTGGIYEGGNHGGGVLFEFDPVTGAYSKKVDFEGQPDGSFVLAPNGKLYSALRSNSHFIEYDPAIDKMLYRNLADGTAPSGNIVLASNGKIYGTTKNGGIKRYGMIYEFDPSTLAVSFRDFAESKNTFGAYDDTNGVTEGPNNKIYWLTSGDFMFEYDISTRVSSQIIDFASLNASAPLGTMTYASNGKLYGMTKSGGDSDNGIIFEYDPVNRQAVKKLDFQISTAGFQPLGSLLPTAGGKLYGLTSKGGSSNSGVLFEYDTLTGVLEKMVDFGGENTGSFPQGVMTQLGNGKIYGVTYSGGTNGDGVLFEFDPSTKTYVKKFNFLSVANGANPTGGVIKSLKGTLFGFAQHGGTGDFGTVFEWDLKTETMILRFDFGKSALGRHPLGIPLQLDDQKIYGLTASGGNGEGGGLFVADPVAKTIETKYTFFVDGANGSYPHGSLVQGANSKLYGLTSMGGSGNKGIIFEYSLQSGFKKKFDFGDLALNGSHPHGTVTVGTNGKLYGLTLDGGTQNGGVLFEYDPTNSVYQKKYDLTELTGKNPLYASLTSFSQFVTGDLPRSFETLAQIYPNPAETFVQFRHAGISSAVPEVYDVNGRKIVLQYENGPDALRIDVTSLENGLYLVHLGNPPSLTVVMY